LVDSSLVSSFVPKQQTLALEVIMEKFFSPINLGSPKERREKARVFKNAIQEGFDAIDDANELRSGNEEIRRMGKRQKLAMHRKLRQLDEMKKAQAVVQNRASLLKKREREDQQHLQAQARVQNSAAGVEITIAESGDDEPYQVKRTKRWSKRPDYWYEIVEHYEELLRGNTAWEIAVAGTMQLYSEELAGKTQFQNYKKILIWMKEKKAGKALQNPGRFPVYGRDIDQATFAAVMSRNTKGPRWTRSS
jgi:hypothetical protein